MAERRIDCASPEGRLICDETVRAGRRWMSAIERIVERLTGSGVVSAAGNRRAFRAAEEPLDAFRRYMAVYAREQAYCHLSPALIANLRRTGMPRHDALEKILILHGPNLNLFGRREPHIYGSMTLDQINERLRTLAAKIQVQLTIVQSNHEGVLVDTFHKHMDEVQGAVINPGAPDAAQRLAARLHQGDAVPGDRVPPLQPHGQARGVAPRLDHLAGREGHRAGARLALLHRCAARAGGNHS